jgi:hypothetical protein
VDVGVARQMLPGRAGCCGSWRGMMNGLAQKVMVWTR